MSNFPVRPIIYICLVISLICPDRGIRIVTAAADPGLEERWIEDEMKTVTAESGTNETEETALLKRVPSKHEHNRPRAVTRGKKVFAIIPGLFRSLCSALLVSHLIRSRFVWREVLRCIASLSHEIPSPQA